MPRNKKLGRDLPKKKGGRKSIAYRPASFPEAHAEAELEARAAFNGTIPDDAVFLCAFIDLPGANEQLTKKWIHHVEWKFNLGEDFRASSKLQDHPDTRLESPEIRIYAAVGGESDLTAWGARYKKAIDLLQPSKMDRLARESGGLGLIGNDKQIFLERNHVIEKLVRKADENGLTRRFVSMFIWEGEK